MNDNHTGRTRLDTLLDLLADEVADRLAERSEPALAAEPDLPPEPWSAPPSRAAALMTRLAFGLLLIVVLINIPFINGIALARSIPSATSLVIANGLVVKEATSPQVWVYRDGAFHWITSLEAFQYLGYRWQDVHIVETGFLKPFPQGYSLSVLLKCDSSPDIYLLDAGRKRWIVDIPTFQAQGYVLQDVKFVTCSTLHDLPDGDSIPPSRGTPTPPLP
ncbi:MAG: hypothetical protein ACR2JY_10435 [Chloroflexota bacterium]